jgi:hypothetical protein
MGHRGRRADCQALLGTIKPVNLRRRLDQSGLVICGRATGPGSAHPELGTAAQITWLGVKTIGFVMGTSRNGRDQPRSSAIGPIRL